MCMCILCVFKKKKSMRAEKVLWLIIAQTFNILVHVWE